MARIGVDLDGVFYDFGAAFRNYYATEHSIDPNTLPPQRTWYFYREWGMTDTEFVEWCHDAADAGVLWNHNAPDPRDLDQLRRLQGRGHTLHVITDRSFGRHPGISQSATAAWLAQHDFPYDTLTFSRDKTVLRTDFMIDDKLGNYDALEQSGCIPVLFDQPWNDDSDMMAVDHFDDGSPLDLRRRRVRSISEFCSFVRGFTAEADVA